MILITHDGTKVVREQEFPAAKRVYGPAGTFTVESRKDLAAELEKRKLTPLPTPEELKEREEALAVIEAGSIVELKNFASARLLPDEEKIKLTMALDQARARTGVKDGEFEAEPTDENSDR